MPVQISSIKIHYVNFGLRIVFSTNWLLAIAVHARTYTTSCKKCNILLSVSNSSFTDVYLSQKNGGGVRICVSACDVTLRVLNRYKIKYKETYISRTPKSSEHL